MMLKKFLLALSLLVSVTAFGQDETTRDLSPIFDISPDNNNIALPLSNGDISTIYIFSLIDDKRTQLTDNKGYYIRPVYSPKGDKIIFLVKDLTAGTSDICSIDLISKKATKLTNGKTYVTEATFTPDGSGIFYCGAGRITNYSPMARKAPHDIDLYSIGIDGTNEKKLTNFSAYQFSDITPNKKGDTILCKFEDGIYLLSLFDTSKTIIQAINNPRPEIGQNFYGSPSFSKDNQQISFTAPYQLYTLNFADKKCEAIWSTFGEDTQAMPIFSEFDASGKKVFFASLAIENRQYANSAKIYSIDLTTQVTTLIAVPLTN